MLPLGSKRWKIDFFKLENSYFTKLLKMDSIAIQQVIKDIDLSVNDVTSCERYANYANIANITKSL